MYVLVEINGKQYKVEKGSTITVDRLNKEVGEEVEFDSVLLKSDESGVEVGTPYLTNVKIKAKVTDQVRGKKVIIFKYKRRKDYRKKQGHRQLYSVLQVEDIVGA